LEGSVTLSSLSLRTVTYGTSYLLVVPAIKHPLILAGGFTLLRLAAFSARTGGQRNQAEANKDSCRFLRAGTNYRNQTDV
jgi:hypothetical protein